MQKQRLLLSFLEHQSACMKYFWGKQTNNRATHLWTRKLYCLTLYNNKYDDVDVKRDHITQIIDSYKHYYVKIEESSKQKTNVKS